MSEEKFWRISLILCAAYLFFLDSVQEYGIAAQRRKVSALSAHKTHTNLGVGTTTDRDTQGRLHTCKYHFHIPPTHTHMAPSFQYRSLTLYVPPQVRPFPLGQPLTTSWQQPPEEEEVDIQLTPPGWNPSTNGETIYIYIHIRGLSQK